MAMSKRERAQVDRLVELGHEYLELGSIEVIDAADGELMTITDPHELAGLVADMIKVIERLSPAACIWRPLRTGESMDRWQRRK